MFFEILSIETNVVTNNHFEQIIFKMKDKTFKYVYTVNNSSRGGVYLYGFDNTKMDWNCIEHLNKTLKLDLASYVIDGNDQRVINSMENAKKRSFKFIERTYYNMF